MPLSYILKRFAQKTGIPCIDYQGITADPDQRQYALDFANEAAKELYESADLPDSLQESIIQIDTSEQISIPSCFGELRALRQITCDVPWKLSGMRPRYCSKSWMDQGWNNWRDKGTYALQRSFDNTAPITFTIPIADPDVVVIVTGSTSSARNVSETMIMDDTSKTLLTQFDFISKIKKNTINNQDIIVTDADGNEVAVLYNDELETKYKVIDASDYLSSFNVDGTFIELLFKKPLRNFHYDEDEFVVPNYDDVLINKMLQLWAEDSGNVQGAIALDGKATRTANRKARDKNESQDNHVEFQPHRHGNIFRRMRKNYY